MEFRSFIQRWLKERNEKDPAEAMSEESQRMAALIREQELSENVEQAKSPAQVEPVAPVQPASQSSSSSPIPVPLDRRAQDSVATPDPAHQLPLLERADYPSVPDFQPLPQSQPAKPHLLAGSNSVSIVRGQVRKPQPGEIQQPTVRKEDFLDTPEVQKLMQDEGVQVEAYTDRSKATVNLVPPGLDSSDFHKMIASIDRVVKIPEVVIGSPAELPPYPDLSALVSTSDKAFAHIARVHNENSKLERFR